MNAVSEVSLVEARNVMLSCEFSGPCLGVDRSSLVRFQVAGSKPEM